MRLSRLNLQKGENMTEKALAKEINEFFKKDRSDEILYNSPVWGAIKNGIKGTGRKIKFKNRGKSWAEINARDY